MSLGPKAGGALGVVLGVGCTGYTWYTAHNEGHFSLALCLIGPIALVLSLGFLLLPLNKLVIPTEIDGKMDYNLKNPSYTPLGMLIFGLGIVASGLYFAYLKFGLGS